MRLLILGGTQFVGRHLTEAALAGGHEVSLFHRGRTNPGLFPEAEHLQGDRGGDLAPLKGRSWDAVIDVSGYIPKHVRASTRLLADAVERYVFVSTISVYESLKTLGIDESAPLEGPQPGDEEADEIPPDGYGRLKVLCERHVEEAFPGRSLTVRPCVIVGPWDHTGRFAYWVKRGGRDGEILAPGRPGRPVELIDARDLAEWLVRMTERQATGLFNATGPAGILTMRELLETCREATGGGASFVWVDDRFLEERELSFPFWWPEESVGYGYVDHSRAMAEGLTYRPLAQTVRDVQAWVAEDPEGRSRDRLTPEQEAELLREWRASAR